MKHFIISLLIIFYCTIIHTQEKTLFIFGQPPQQQKLIPSSLYKDFVTMMPICCVDVFIYHPPTATYLLIERLAQPALSEFWYIGGRLFKGESFFTCAQRKCFEEAQLEVTLHITLGVYETMFDTSAWDIPTHTCNIAVFATCNAQEITLNNAHGSHRWIALTQAPTIPYLKTIYDHAYSYIIHHTF